MRTTDDLPVPWGLLDLATKQRQQPRFSIGLRFGDGEALTRGPLAELPVPSYPMRRHEVDDELQSTWGSRGAGNDGIHGDEVFDLRARGIDLSRSTSGPRPAGADGQVLFHLIHRAPGEASLAIGIVLPLGGPDNVDARNRKAAGR